MKRLFLFMMVLLIFFSCCVICVAAKQEETHRASVYAKVNRSANGGMYSATANGRQYGIRTEDGTQITVQSDAFDLVLVVHQITEEQQEAYAWLESCVAQPAIRFIPYDIYFLNGSGERRELSDENTVTVVPARSVQRVLGVSYEGRVTDIPYRGSGDSVTFSAADTGSYYLLCENMGDMKTPQTGDTGRTAIEYCTGILCGALLVLLILHLGKAKPSVMQNDTRRH